MSKKKVIIFDYDGVIVDSFPSVHRVYQKVCLRLEKKCPENFVTFRKMYGYNSRQLMKNLGLTIVEMEKANVFYTKEIILENPSLFKGVDEVIKQLAKDYTLVLLSSSPQQEIESKLKKFYLDGFFKMIVGATKSGPLEKKEALGIIFDTLKIRPKDVILIGDRTIDYDKGVAAGVSPDKIILVEYGWGYDKEKVPRQKVKVRKPIDLIKAVEVIH